MAGIALSLLGSLPLAGCATAQPTAAPSPSAAGVGHIVSGRDPIAMTAWVVPANARSRYLQVRLAPRVPVAEAILTVAAKGLSVSPHGFLLRDLQPNLPARQPNSPPNPPALGMTVLRTFRVTATHAGAYRVVVELRVGSTLITKIVNIVIQSTS